MKASAFLLLGALAITGCANVAGPSMFDDPSIACFKQLVEDPAITVLNPKVGKVSDANSASIAQLADTSKPTASEKDALAAWGAGRMRCIEAGRAFRGQHAPPGYGAVMENTQSELVTLTAQLYAGDITYGQFNMARNRVARDNDIRMEQVRQNFIQAIDAEQAQRANAALTMMQIQQQNRPLTTNCNRFGNSVSCTTR